MNERLMLVTVLSAALAGCASPPDAVESGADDGTSALVGGKVTTARPEVGRVDFVSKHDEHSHCTGALVAPNVVLTSDGCEFLSFETKGVTFFIDQDLDGDGTIDKSNAFQGSFWESVSKSSEGEEVDSRHMTFITLASKVPAAIAKPAVLRKGALADNEVVSIVGYGKKSSEEWAPKNLVKVPYHYGEAGFFKVPVGPEVLQAADLGSPIFDSAGLLVAVGVKTGFGGFLIKTVDDFELVCDAFYGPAQAKIDEMARRR